MLISHKGHTDTIQVYSVTVMTHVKALQAGIAMTIVYFVAAHLPRRLGGGGGGLGGGGAGGGGTTPIRGISFILCVSE